MKMIGEKALFAIEIGRLNEESPPLRVVDIWAGGVRLCVDDNTAYLPQFTGDLKDELSRSFFSEKFETYFEGKTPI
ncbi:MAG: hypothetical protein ACSHYA_18185 [Opitutaceae bacterium]